MHPLLTVVLASPLLLAAAVGFVRHFLRAWRRWAQ